MKREIKFRGYDKGLKEMCYSPLHSISFSGVLNYGNADFEDYPIVLMQYTGLKDKNGKEIYEGDILQFTEADEDSAFGAEETNIIEVKWIDEIAQWRAVFKNGRRTVLHLVVQLPTIVSCEIIGNIYENPSLLESKE